MASEPVIDTMPGVTAGAGAAEAERWVADALETVREQFGEVPDAQLRGPLAEAFGLASRSARTEREFHEIFGAELRRAIEEREVMGSSASVLPSAGVKRRTPFGLSAEEPPPELAEPEPPEPDRGDHERARRFGLAVAATRFEEQLTPQEIGRRFEIEPAYYRDIMRWVLQEVDRSLGAAYPPEVNRPLLAMYAAGLTSEETASAVERHIVDCAGCAGYMADLTDAVHALAASELGAPLSQVRVPRERIKAADLRRYVIRVPRRRKPAPEERTRRRRSPAAIVASGLVVVVAVVATVSLGTGPAARDTATVTTPRPSADAAHAAAADAARRRAAKAEAARRAAKAAARRRAVRAAARRRAAKAAARRRAARARARQRAAAERRARERRLQQRPQTRTAPPTAVPPVPQAPAPAPVAPAPAAPSPSSPPEFGLEP